MSKYDALWDYVKSRDTDLFKLTFDEIERIIGFPIDHSFLNSKKELILYGYTVGKISLEEKTVSFIKSEA